MVIVVGRDRRVIVDAGFDAAALARLLQVLARISHTTDHKSRFGLLGAVFGLLLCFLPAAITELALGESRGPRLHGLRVETGTRHRPVLTLEL